MKLLEGNMDKGGLNDKPSIFRNFEPPKGQGENGLSKNYFVFNDTSIIFTKNVRYITKILDSKYENDLNCCFEIWLDNKTIRIYSTNTNFLNEEREKFIEWLNS